MQDKFNEFYLAPQKEIYTYYHLDMNKIKTLDDVKNILNALVGEIAIRNNISDKRYEKLKDYLK